MTNFVYSAQNKNARIVSRVSRNGKLRTETRRRDSGSANMAVSTDPNTKATNLFIDFEDGDYVKLTGRQARTLYRVLQAHYEYTSRSR